MLLEKHFLYSICYKKNNEKCNDDVSDPFVERKLFSGILVSSINLYISVVKAPG